MVFNYNLGNIFFYSIFYENRTTQNIVYKTEEFTYETQWGTRTGIRSYTKEEPCEPYNCLTCVRYSDSDVCVLPNDVTSINNGDSTIDYNPDKQRVMVITNDNCTIGAYAFYGFNGIVFAPSGTKWQYQNAIYDFDGCKSEYNKYSSVGINEVTFIEY